MGTSSVRRGIRKWRAKAPQWEGKGPKIFFKTNVFLKILKEKNVLQILRW